jgi:hypothetical protein
MKKRKLKEKREKRGMTKEEKREKEHHVCQDFAV